MSDEIFVFNQPELVRALALLSFTEHQAVAIADRWLASRGAATVGSTSVYVADRDTWGDFDDTLEARTELDTATKGVRRDIARPFWQMSVEQRADFLVGESGLFVLSLVALTSTDAQERIRTLLGRTRQAAYRSASFMYAWLSDFQRLQDEGV